MDIGADDNGGDDGVDHAAGNSECVFDSCTYSKENRVIRKLSFAEI